MSVTSSSRSGVKVFQNPRTRELGYVQNSLHRCSYSKWVWVWTQGQRSHLWKALALAAASIVWLTYPILDQTRVRWWRHWANHVSSLLHLPLCGVGIGQQRLLAAELMQLLDPLYSNAPCSELLFVFSVFNKYVTRSCDTAVRSSLL